MATTKITIQQFVGLNPTNFTVSKYPKFVVNLGTSITGVTVGDLTDAVTKTAASAALAKASELAAKTSETNAKASETAAKTSETNAKTSETNAKTSETTTAGLISQAQDSADASEASALTAKASETAAKISETNAAESASEASTSEANAKIAETNAAASASAAAASESAAKASETNAKTSETNAASSAAAAKVSETNAGTSATTADTEADRAKAEADRAEQILNDKLDKEDISTFIKTYQTYAEAIADVNNRVLDEKVMVWNQTAAKYGWYKVTGTTGALTLALQTEEVKLITVNNVRPDSDGNVQVTIPGGNPSLWLGEITLFPYDKDNGIGYSGVLPADGREVNRVDYPDTWTAIDTGLIPSVSEADWQAGKNMYFSKGNGTTTFRLPNMLQGQAFRAPTKDEAGTAELQTQVPFVTTVNGKSPDEATGAVTISGSDLNSTVPIAKGGTGAATVADARTALLVDRIEQAATQTAVYSQNTRYALILNNSGDWGCYDTVGANTKPLSILYGGTGARIAADARTNLNALGIGDYGIGADNGSQSQITSLTEGNSTTLKTGLYACNGDYVGAPFGVGNGQFVGVITLNNTNGNNYKTQIATSYSAAGRVFFRSMNAGTYRAWNEIYHSNSVIPIGNGGTGATTVADARTNLGLGTAATKNVQTTQWEQNSSAVMMVNAFGLGAQFSQSLSNNANDIFGYNGFVSGGGANGTNWANAYSTMLVLNRTTGCEQLQILAGGTVVARSGNSTTGFTTPWATHYNTANTTKAADGTLKAASPIVKIYKDGTSETNGESEGAIVERLDVGQYLVTNILGMNSDAGWGGIDGGFDIPTDRNKQPLIWLDYRVNVDGSVLVKTYHRTHPNAPAFAQNNKEGYSEADPIDIPSDQFVSIRVEMPEDSIYNTRLREEQEARTLADKELEEQSIEDNISDPNQETTLGA